MENNESVVTTTETVEQTAEATTQEVQAPKKEGKTYTRAEVEAIKKAERENLLKEIEAKQSEAEKLAKMDTDQKHQYELEKIQKELDAERAKNNAHELRDTVSKIAEEKGIGASLLEMFDFTRETAESMNRNIQILSSEIDKRVEQRVNELLKEKSPKQVSTQGLGDTNKKYLDEKYKNNPYYKKK
ncbi:MAG: DUF4355 domain-containing protein [Methanosphaera sp.]|nr:DUF4355 domain-containing protein [Methanosphaera sp.]